MTRRSLRKRRTPLRVRSIDDEYDDDDVDVDVDVEEEEEEEEVHDQKDKDGTSSREMGMQIVCFSQQPFTLPDGWIVEQRPRPSNPSHVDKYYYEPRSGRQFRSLLAVQRYLTESTRDCRTTERMISENEDTTYIEPGTGQQRIRSLRTVETYLTGENACTATPKVPTPSKQVTSVVKSGTGNQSARGLRSCGRAVKKRSSVAEEDKVTPEALKHSVQSTHTSKSDSPNKINSRTASMHNLSRPPEKINSEKDNTASMHNLSRPPEKVTWVLSGPGGFWSPFVDDSIVPESEKLKWSEAFVLSVRGGDQR